MTFLLTVAWRNLWRHKRRSLITATAMAVGVALCMASVAFQDGMFVSIFEVMVEQQLGHVQVHHPEWPAKRVLHDTLTDGTALLARVDAVEGTVAASPRLQGFVLLGTESESVGALLVGVDPIRESKVTPIAERVVAGRFLAEAPASEVVLGERLARDLHVEIGQSLVAVTQAADGSLGNVLFTLVGTVRTGNAQIDKAGAFVHLTDLQDLLVLPDQLHNVTVLSDDISDIAAFSARAQGALGSDVIAVVPWWEASPQAAQMMDMRDFAAAIVLGIVFVAAGFGVLNTMMMSVFERTRELGVLKAVGMRPARMVALIMVESVLLAGIAAAIGLVLGGALDTYLVLVGVDLSAATPDGISFSGIVLDPVIKGAVRVEGVLAILAAVVVVSVLSSLYPAIRAARLEPVAALRAE